VARAVERLLQPDGNSVTAFPDVGAARSPDDVAKPPRSAVRTRGHPDQMPIARTVSVHDVHPLRWSGAGWAPGMAPASTDECPCPMRFAWQNSAEQPGIRCRDDPNRRVGSSAEQEETVLPNPTRAVAGMVVIHRRHQLRISLPHQANPRRSGRATRTLPGRHDRVRGGPLPFHKPADLGLRTEAVGGGRPRTASTATRTATTSASL
jgi:hypothetical protein